MMDPSEINHTTKRSELARSDEIVEMIRIASLTHQLMVIMKQVMALAENEKEGSQCHKMVTIITETVRVGEGATVAMVNQMGKIVKRGGEMAKLGKTKMLNGLTCSEP